VVVAVPTSAVADIGGGEEDRRRDEDDPGNDYHPRGGLVEPARLGRRRAGGACLGSGVSVIVRIMPANVVAVGWFGL
jgi:hypothetical protein